MGEKDDSAATGAVAPERVMGRTEVLHLAEAELRVIYQRLRDMPHTPASQMAEKYVMEAVFKVREALDGK